jgi:hypothetical protein
VAYSAQVRRYLDLFAGLAPADDPDDPHLILATMVGAIGLARAVDDPGIFDEIPKRGRLSIAPPRSRRVRTIRRCRGYP